METITWWRNEHSNVTSPIAWCMHKAYIYMVFVTLSKSVYYVPDGSSGVNLTTCLILETIFISMFTRRDQVCRLVGILPTLFMRLHNVILLKCCGHSDFTL